MAGHLDFISYNHGQSQLPDWHRRKVNHKGWSQLPNWWIEEKPITKGDTL